MIFLYCRCIYPPLAVRALHPSTTLAIRPPAAITMAEPTAEEVEVETVEARPLRTTIRYTTESNRTRNRHVTVNFDSIHHGDIGGLYAAVSGAITRDLNRLRRESRLGSSKASSFFSGAVADSSSGAPPAQLNPIDCDLKIELCRLLDKSGMLFLPPVKDTSVFRQKHAQLQSSNSQDPRDKKYDLLAFLLDRDVKNGWDHLQDGMFFEEEDGWPWYCLLVSFSHGLFLFPFPLDGDGSEE